MQLILEENCFKFNEKHFVQTHGIAMGAKMAVSFSVVFMADMEKRLLAASPLKLFSVHTSNPATHSIRKRVLLKEKQCIFQEPAQSRKIL